MAPLVALRASRSSPPGQAAASRAADVAFWLALGASVQRLALVAGEQGSACEPSEACMLRSQKARRKARLGIPF